MARKQTQSTKPDPLNQQVHAETTKPIIAQFKGTFDRIQYDYAETGRRMGRGNLCCPA